MKIGLKELVISLLHPLRGPITRACQSGWLPSSLQKFMPWRWVFEPFTIYGDGWRCQWFPTEFDSVGQRVFWSGLREWEKETNPVILDNLGRSRCFVDIGANCGIYTVLGCSINPNLTVLAVEPVPRVCQALQRNVTNNEFDSRVTILNTALGDTNGQVSFHEAEDSTMGSLNVAGYRGQKGRVIQVGIRTLDSVIDELKINPDFMKIDVEGFEEAVLRGANSVIAKFRPRIVLEANSGDPCDGISDLLLGYGYEFHHLTESGPVIRSRIIAADGCSNWLCVARS